MLAGLINEMEEGRMMKSLRKKHLQVWFLWALLLPLLMIAAWLAVPSFPKNKLWQPATVAVLPLVLQTVKKDVCTASIRANYEKNAFQLEWVSKNYPLLPSLLLYKKASAGNELIGRIGPAGTYYFPLDSGFQPRSGSMPQILLYDIIQQKIIDSIKFQP